MKAIWNGMILAESSETQVVEGNHYFPADTINAECFLPSEKTSVCPWKGTASYYNIAVGGELNNNAAWYYPEPKPEAGHITGHIAFWKGVEVTE